MPDTFTPNLNLDQPAVGADNDTWGTILNSDLAAIDAVFAPDGSGTSVGLNVGAGKTFSLGGTLAALATAVISFFASTFSLKDATDASKVLKFDVSAVSAATTRTLTAPDASGKLVLEDGAAVLTNKTFDTAGAGNVLKINGVAVSDNNGTGKVVRDTSPALAGTPTAPTAAEGATGAQLATLDYVLAAIASLKVRTGTLRPTQQQTAEAGWILWTAGTLSNAAGGGTCYHGDDAAALYALYWGFGDTICPLVGATRGTDAASDFAAGKQIQMPPGPGKVLGIVGSGHAFGNAVGSESSSASFSLPSSGTGLSSGGNYGFAPSGNYGTSGFSIMQPTAFWNIEIAL